MPKKDNVSKKSTLKSINCTTWISVLLSGFQYKKGETQDLEEERSELDPWSLYIYAMKAPMTRDIMKFLYQSSCD
jgi:hypothetical protein